MQSVDNLQIKEWYLKLTTDVDLTFATTILLAIIGWIFSLWLQQNGAKNQHKIQIQYEIYKQFVELHKKIQDSTAKLNAKSSAPFILMESSMIPFELGLKKEYKDSWIPYSEQECLFEGEKKWNEFTRALYQDYSQLTDEYIQFSYIFEDWESALNPLLSIKQVLSSEVEKDRKIIFNSISELQSYATKHSHDWRKWDQKDAEKISKKIKESAMNISCYMSDFMVLVHNQLLSSYFGFERATRMTLDPKFTVLTKDGIVANLDHELIQNAVRWKQQLKKQVAVPNSQASQYSSVLDGICHECGADILVLNLESTTEGSRFTFACGHSLDLNNEPAASKNI